MLEGRKLRLMLFITGVVDARSRAPSYSEIMEALGYCSRGNIHSDLHDLEREGFIRIEKGRKRGIKVLRRHPRVSIYRRQCPCCQRDWPRV